jgi:hypothetical protein
VTAPTEPVTPALDAEGRVAADIPCVRCGYNVRTLPATGVCPECAHPVAWSLRGSGLCYAPPAWLRRINGGVLVLLCTLGGLFVCMAGSICASVYLGLTSSDDGQAVPNEYAALGALIFFSWGAVWLVVGVVGLVLLTAREPLARERQADSLARRITRVCLVTTIILAALGLLTIMLARTGMPGLACAALRFVGAGAWCAVLLVSLVVPVAAVRYVGRLMQRAARPALALFARIAVWCLLGLVVLMIAAWSALVVQAIGIAGSLRSGSAAGTTAAVGPLTGPVEESASSSAAPATLPAGPASAGSPTFAPSPAFYITMMASGLGGCGFFVVGSAIFVLLILVRRTLNGVIREAEQNAHIATGVPPGTEPQA